MAIKTFTAGSVLTASDTNTYLNNGGLVYITEATASGSATTLSINNCFSSTYNNYRIMVDYFQPATAGRGVKMRMRVGGVDASGTDYYWSFNGLYVDSTSANAASGAGGNAELDTGIYNSANTLGIGSCAMDIYAPNKTERTFMTYQAILYNTQFGNRNGFAEHNLTTAYDGFTLFLNSTGNITNLRVKVYGYRQA